MASPKGVYNEYSWFTFCNRREYKLPGAAKQFKRAIEDQKQDGHI